MKKLLVRPRVSPSGTLNCARMAVVSLQRQSGPPHNFRPHLVTFGITDTFRICSFSTNLLLTISPITTGARPNPGGPGRRQMPCHPLHPHFFNDLSSHSQECRWILGGGQGYNQPWQSLGPQQGQQSVPPCLLKPSSYRESFNRVEMGTVTGVLCVSPGLEP